MDYNGTLTKTINHSIVVKILPSLRSNPPQSLHIPPLLTLPPRSQAKQSSPPSSVHHHHSHIHHQHHQHHHHHHHCHLQSHQGKISSAKLMVIVKSGLDSLLSRSELLFYDFILIFHPPQR